MKILGIPIHYDEKARIISDSRGLWPFKRIVVGPAFWRFGPREMQAILLHEVAHCKLFHLERRLLRAIFFPGSIKEFCFAQEFQADNFVALTGYGKDLASVFSKVKQTEQILHPPTAERIERLLACSKG